MYYNDRYMLVGILEGILLLYHTMYGTLYAIMIFFLQLSIGYCLFNVINHNIIIWCQISFRNTKYISNIIYLLVIT